LEKTSATNANHVFHQPSSFLVINAKKFQLAIVMRNSMKKPKHAEDAPIICCQVMVFSLSQASAEYSITNVMSQVKSNYPKVNATNAKIVHQDIELSEIFASQ